MAKRFEDLDLPDEHESEWYQFCEKIDDLILTDNYSWALDTLEGIRETVERSRRVTDGQRRAVENIENARQEDRAPSQRQFRRRYEGFRWR